MSVWFFILVATAFGGALTLWYSVSRAKHVSERLLKEYAQMLAAAREEKKKELEAKRKEEEEAAAVAE